MRTPSTYLGIDLGASGCRAVLGTLTSGKLAVEDVHRFPNVPVSVAGTLRWDFPFLWKNVVESIRLGVQRSPEGFAGIGIDTWGCDFGLVGKDGKLLANPVCYRDRVTEGMDIEMRSTITEWELFSLTGMTLSRIATLPQLIALQRRGHAELINATELMLLMPDLFRYFLCGARSSELTSLGTSLLTDVRSRTYCTRIIDAFGIPRRILPRIEPTGTVAGLLSSELQQETGAGAVPIMMTAGHDTLAAAAAAPISSPRDLFISSGTWSVIGLIREEPIATPEALAAGFVNELGVGSVTFVKNFMGFSFLETLRKAWGADGRVEGWEQMIRAAEGAAPFRVVLDLEDPIFFAPADPRKALGNYLLKTNQEKDPGMAVIARANYEGLALAFRRAIEELEKVMGESVGDISLVGGGSRNALFCQLVADATGREVRAGPAETTVIGNIGVQAIAAGELSRPEEIRQLVARSFPLARYAPYHTEGWDHPYRRYCEMREARSGGS